MCPLQCLLESFLDIQRCKKSERRDERGAKEAKSVNFAAKDRVSSERTLAQAGAGSPIGLQLVIMFAFTFDSPSEVTLRQAQRLALADKRKYD